MSRRLAVILVALGVLTLWGPAAHAAEGTAPNATARDAIALARQRLDETKAQATELAGKLSTAQAQQAQLSAEIVDTQQKIPALRAKAAELRTRVRERAASLYVQRGASSAFESTMDAESTQDGLRAAHLTDTIGTQDLAAATELRETATKLVAREAALEQQRADLQKTVAQLEPLNDQLQKKLQVASALYDKVHALVIEGVSKDGADVATGATVCPVQGVVVFTDDFGVLRTGGAHPGIDMAALPETPVVAVTDGIWRHDVGGDGGNGAWLVGVDGNSYYYAHFSKYPPGDGGLVKAGDVIGYVGSTGNATGPHLHFEIHKGGATEPPVDPFATLLTLCSDNAPPPKAN